MSVKERGLTIDLGYPLSEKDMDLFIELFPEQGARCMTWIKDRNDTRPLMLAGQIGTGKTTFLNHIFLETGIKPDIKLCFDKDDFDRSIEGFLGYVFFMIFQVLAGLKINVEKWGATGDLFKQAGININKMIASFFFQESGVEAKKTREMLLKLFENYGEDFKVQLNEMLMVLSQEIGRPPLIVCEGIDKYHISGCDIRLLSPSLSVLSNDAVKILYELNLLYTIRPDFDWQKKEVATVILTASDTDKIKEILLMRAGIYSDLRKSIFDILARLSGGNPRQAIRLHAEFEYGYESLKKSKDEAVNYACDRVRSDFLRSGIIAFSPQHLKTVKSDGFFVPSTEPPIYWNWILAISEPKEGTIPSKVNPLLLPAIESMKDLNIEDPEIQKLKLWAKEKETSPFGLTIPYDPRIPADKNYDNFIDEMNKSELLGPALSLEKIFNELASFFLTPRFHSLYLIIYRDLNLARLASDYICGKAGALAERSFVQRVINKEITSFNHFKDLLIKYDGLSLFFDESLNAEDVLWCEIKRDQLINKRIILWANKAKALYYLNVWPHLRQFVRIIELEKELWRDITPHEIEEDLRLLVNTAIPDDHKGMIKKKLNRALISLKEEMKRNA